MPTFKRYIARDGQRILFFTSKPTSWSKTYWKDVYGNWFRVASVTHHEATDYDGLMELPEGKLVEVEMRVKVLNR